MVIGGSIQGGSDGGGRVLYNVVVKVIEVEAGSAHLAVEVASVQVVGDGDE